MDKKHIILYSGSFNPIHNGHIGLINYILNNSFADEVWLIVSPQNPLKENSVLLSDHLRLEMTRLAVADIANVCVCDIEFQLPKPSYTINTLQTLSKEYPDLKFSLLIGADNAEKFSLWKNYQEILDSYNVLVYPRNGFHQDMNAYPSMQYIHAPLFEISSTEIRNNIASGRDYSDKVPAAVAAFIKEKGLYQI